MLKPEKDFSPARVASLVNSVRQLSGIGAARIFAARVYPNLASWLVN
jgi:hypothetical protein